MHHGVFIQPEFSVAGGTRIERTPVGTEAINRGRGLRTDYKATKIVDDLDMEAEAVQIRTRAYYILGKYCAKTPLGYFADDEALASIEADLAPVREAASIFNRASESIGSPRRVVVEIYTLELREGDERAAARLAKHVVDRLRELRAALKAGDRKSFEAAWDRVGNLDRLASGIQAEAVREALEEAKAMKARLLEMIRFGYAPAAAGEQINTDSIEATEGLFL